jgi:glycogen phosphorylase/synthase
MSDQTICPIPNSDEPARNNTFLFEVSWEVCNKIGGIYTVIHSKIKQVIKYFENRYICIGPLRDKNKHFVEYTDLPAHLSQIKALLDAKGIPYKLGYWDTEGDPTVILIDFVNRYKIDMVLYNLWAGFGVDSLASNYEYYEPILFATAAAEIIETLAPSIFAKQQQIVAHFHEWLCGAGSLYLKKQCPNIATVFTTHATVLGRSLASDGKLIYSLPANFNANAEAKKYNVFSKYSLERAAAKEVDCFTTVSNITADEANMILGKYPDKIILNGLDIERKQQLVYVAKIAETRSKLRTIASKIIGKTLPDNTCLLLTSGRYEFHNKGYDVLLKSLAQLENSLPNDAPPIVVFFLIAVNWHTKEDSLIDTVLPDNSEQKFSQGIATHKIWNPINDNVLKLCEELNLKQPERKIHIVYCDAYLSGNDGVFDILYEQILAACDLSIFPSYYEPWGYTPLESIAYGTPTITTDLAGFGYWVKNLKHDYKDAVYILPRKNSNDNETIKYLAQVLLDYIKQPQTEDCKATIRKKSLAISALADWEYFYEDYLDAYSQALKFNVLRVKAKDLESQAVTSIQEAGVTLPRFRSFQYECLLPDQLAGLRELAYNFWWSWHNSAKLLFQRIDPVLWERVRHNPVYFLNFVPSPALQKAACDDDYLLLYNRVIAKFKGYTQSTHEIGKLCTNTPINNQHPIAYFCMEYGIDECLPIYSGGLGILAGDYLKTMSDLSIPMIAIGLFYKQGYFLQHVDASGEQIAIYETWNTNQIPMKIVNDSSGKPLLTSVEILGRNVYMCAWEVKVGQISLYLLDTNIAENNAVDREITNSLYGGSREVRLMQEIVLGIGGTKFILEKLNIKPALYHLNEGHSAFLLLERIRYFCHQGYSFAESFEAVRYSSIFTTHTPVPAGNEEFTEELIKKYFADYVGALGITIDKLLSLAQGFDAKVKTFSMTVLALKLTLSANAVSSLHGKVARRMWQSVWPGLLENEIPIDVVTNGVHVATWLGQPMKLLYKDYLAQDWACKQDDHVIWDQIATIPDVEFWRAHQMQKEKLLKIVEKLIVQQYSARNESELLIESSLRCINPHTLLIGISRRFTSYKRNDLFIRDKKRLAQILTNEKRPVVILIAGKAHPADLGGIELIRSIVETLREEMFHGHLIFLEEYNIGLAKLLVQGVDVWLNTPILGREACGTSGMKVAVNGGLNFSTLDGWWDEAYDSGLGWEIESLVSIADVEKRNDLENMFLLNTLETGIAPLYYDNRKSGFSTSWVSKMKTSIAFISRQYNTYRMSRDYVHYLYVPVALQNEQMLQNNAVDLKALSIWKQDILTKFNTVKIKAIIIEGIKDGKIIYQGKIRIKLLVYSGKLGANELRAEFILLKGEREMYEESFNSEGYGSNVIVVPLKRVNSREDGVLTFAEDYQVKDTGFYSYGVRIFPYNGMLYRQQDAGVVYWG